MSEYRCAVLLQDSHRKYLIHPDMGLRRKFDMISIGLLVYCFTLALNPKP